MLPPSITQASIIIYQKDPASSKIGIVTIKIALVPIIN